MKKFNYKLKLIYDKMVSIILILLLLCRKKKSFITTLSKINNHLYK